MPRLPSRLDLRLQFNDRSIRDGLIGATYWKFATYARTTTKEIKGPEETQHSQFLKNATLLRLKKLINKYAPDSPSCDSYTADEIDMFARHGRADVPSPSTRSQSTKQVVSMLEDMDPNQTFDSFGCLQRSETTCIDSIPESLKNSNGCRVAAALPLINQADQRDSEVVLPQQILKSGDSGLSRLGSPLTAARLIAGGIRGRHSGQEFCRHFIGLTELRLIFMEVDEKELGEECLTFCMHLRPREQGQCLSYEFARASSGRDEKVIRQWTDETHCGVLEVVHNILDRPGPARLRT